MTPAAKSLLAELDKTLGKTAKGWRHDALRQIADLFLSGAPSYTEDQIAVFDEVMCRLMKNVERAPLAELSNRLAPLDKAPVKVVGTLARHGDSAIHGPILEQGKALPEEDLVEIVGKNQIDPKLLMRMATRTPLGPTVTDVMLKRGTPAIQRALVGNPKARISESGFARLIMGINGDKQLAAAIAARPDVPPELRIWLDKTLNS